MYDGMGQSLVVGLTGGGALDTRRLRALGAPVCLMVLVTLMFATR